jgi:hypothetical protein
MGKQLRRSLEQWEKDILAAVQSPATKKLKLKHKNKRSYKCKIKKGMKTHKRRCIKK